MKRGTIFCFYLFMVATTAGCGSISKPMESWMGRHVNELTGDWGMPQQIMYEEDGGLIYVYHRSEEMIRYKEKSSVEENETDSIPTASSDRDPFQTPEVKNDHTAEAVSTETKAYPKRSMLWINQEGVIYKWAWGTW